MKNSLHNLREMKAQQVHINHRIGDTTYHATMHYSAVLAIWVLRQMFWNMHEIEWPLRRAW